MRLKNTHNKHTLGFTIVELLLVVVVIGILAAIVISAYTGVQARAQAAQTENIVGQYKKGLLAYLQIHGNYPKQNASFCVGEQSDFPNGCFAATATNNSIATALKTVMDGSLPHVDSSCHSYGSGCRRNLTFFYQATATLDGKPHPYYLVYYLNNDQKCTLSGNVGGKWTNYKTTPNASGRLEGGSGTSMCMIAMPTPK